MAIRQCVKILECPAGMKTVQNKIGWLNGKLKEEGFEKSQADSIITQALDQATT